MLSKTSINRDMSKEIEELMQKSVICDNVELTNIIADIVPKKEKRFTDVEIEVSKKEEFSIVVYQKPSVIKRIYTSVKMFMEKLNIIKHSKEFVYVKNYNK